MSWWKKLMSREEDDREVVDYYREGVELLNAGSYHEALTSFRLALKESPDDPAVLQQIAIAYTRIGLTGDAIKTYRSVLQKDPTAVGAHYGLAFLVLREGREEEAVSHLRAFLADPPSGPEADAYIAHARRKLAELTGEPLVEDIADSGTGP